MSPIQFILILLLVITAGTYFHRLRSRFLDNVIVLVLGVAGVVMIVMPKWTTLLAHSLGVGRGVDLIMYLAWIGMIFVSLLLYSKLRALEAHLTELVRIHAIEEALRPARRSME
jgi:hypothetical protein